MMMTMTTPKTHTTRHERTCVGCRRKDAADALVRLVVGPAGESCEVVVDAAGGGFGRGVHVHASRDCVEKACRGGLAAAAKRAVVANADGLCAAIGEAYERRAMGLLMGARRAGYLALGADAAAKALGEGAKVIVLATDAGADVRKAFSRTSVLAFGDKASLGNLFGTAETAVFAVRHDGVAKALSEALYTATAVGLGRSPSAKIPEER